MRDKRKIRALTLGAMLLAMLLMSNAQLLKGVIKGFTVDEPGVNYSPDGYALNAKMNDLKIQKDGSFTFDMNFQGPTADVGIDLGANGYFGAHLVKGKTVKMAIEKKGAEYDVKFSGADVKINYLVNQITRSFDSMKYWSPDPSESKPNATYRALLETEYAKVKALLPTIKDNKVRDYYARLSEGNYKWTKIRLIMDACENGAKYQDNEEFKQAIAGIDVNAPINYQTNLSLTAINNMVKAPLEGNNEAYCREEMALVDKIVTLPELRTLMVNMIGQKYFLFGNGVGGDQEAFIRDYLKFAGKDSIKVKSLIQQFKSKQESSKLTKSGKAAPDITLNTPDGKSVQLSSLLNGKFTYIDVWATWCGPCCAEIPFIKKWVAHYKDNPKIRFISISLDANYTAWKNKLDRDKPQWLQFNCDKEENKAITEQWGIIGIPRFIIIGPDGTIRQADAFRPSDDHFQQKLDKIISE